MQATVYSVAAVLLGAIVGSFLNVVIYRLPEGSFLARSRSACRHCGTPIRWYDNVPILGWLWLRGQARCCGGRISLRYPVVEGLTAALFYLLWEYGPHAPVFRGGGLDVENLLGFLFQAYFVATLVACTFIDIDHRILPDALTKPAMVIGCAGALIVSERGLAGRFSVDGLAPAADSLLFSVTGLLVGYGGTLALLKLARVVFRKDALGYGDVKFMGAIGAFVGWQGVLLTFFLGSVLGAIGGILHRMRTGDAYVYFGPFLAGGALLALLAEDRILTVFESFQRWQLDDPNAPMVLAVAAALSLFLLVILVRRGRAR